jgi:hypothetical protein
MKRISMIRFLCVAEKFVPQMTLNTQKKKKSHLRHPRHLRAKFQLKKRPN